MGDRIIKLVFFLSVLVTASSSAFHPQTKPPVTMNGGERTSSAVFGLVGNVYPLGLYYLSMMIGNPPKPYFLHIDTGSDLTWLQCDAPCVRCSRVPHPYYRPSPTKHDLIPCNHELCLEVHQSTGYEPPCKSPAQCDYKIGYASKVTSSGVLINDTFNLPLINSNVVRPHHLVFGCGYDQQGLNAPQKADGIIGLRNGKSSILSQLRAQGVTKNVIVHCLSSRGGGFLYFGDDYVPPPSAGVTWAPMSQRTLKEHYSPGKANLYLGRQSLPAMAIPAILDSGSTFTYFPKQPYEAFLTALKNGLINAPLKEAFHEDPYLPICWKGPNPFKSVSDVKKSFPDLTLNFINGGKSAPMQIPAENYLVITKLGNACLGILNGTEEGLEDFIQIGDISMQDIMVIYDNENKQIGWIRANCDRPPTSPL